MTTTTHYSNPIADLAAIPVSGESPSSHHPILKAELPQYVDSTMITCYRGCAQKFYKEFCLGLRPPGLSIDLHAGGCFALAIETTQRGIWLYNHSFDEALMRAQAAFEVAWGDFEIPEFKKTAKTRERMWEAVLDYFREYPPLTDPCTPYFDAAGIPTFEYTFAIPLIKTRAGRNFPIHPTTKDPFLYSGRFDMLGNYDGHPTPRDDKTTSYIGAGWTELWRLRNQFIGYTWACRECGFDTEGVLVRGVAILKTLFHHAQHYQSYSQNLIDRWEDQLCSDLWRIYGSWIEGKWDYDFADNCTSYQKPCMFMDSCVSANPAAWLSTMEVRRWNPLVKNPVGSENPSTESAS